MLITKEEQTEQVAVSRKKQQLEPRFFGIRVGPRYDVVSTRKVFVPYFKITMAYKINRSGPFGVGQMRKDGELNLIVDRYQNHAFYLGPEENIKLVKRNYSSNEIIQLEPICGEDDAINKAKAYARWKILYRLYRGIADLEIKEIVPFYRPMWEILFNVRGQKAARVAPADQYDVCSENIRGLRSDPNKP